MFFHCWQERMHRHYHAMHRHHGRGGFFGRHGFGDEAGRGVFGRGRKLGSADLQLLLLALLAEQPSHGYELIKALDERSGGWYVPSPGMVYPALTYLEETGHASVEVEGTKKRYSITDEGRAHLDANRAAVDALLAQLKWIAERAAGMRSAMAGNAGGSADDSGDLRDARRALQAAIRDAVEAAVRGGRRAPQAEQRRIADILERAASEIRGA
ncbi:MAG: PadR family transcriptional regulator [Rubrivivax sp.]|nr:PadR family transcriptional regulator [Rubrivivax sp.]